MLAPDPPALDLLGERIEGNHLGICHRGSAVRQLSAKRMVAIWSDRNQYFPVIELRSDCEQPCRGFQRLGLPSFETVEDQ
jgi:hypothetical protein